MKCIYTVVQPISRALFILQNWNSIPIKQFPILPSPRPLATTVVLSGSLVLWVWLLLVPHISRIMLYLTFWEWLISFSIMSSRFIHAITCHNFLPFSDWIAFCLSCLSINRHLGYFHLLAVVNNAAMYTSVPIILWNLAFSSLAYILRNGIGWHGNSVFNFLRNYHTVFPFMFLLAYTKFQFLHIVTHTSYFLVLIFCFVCSHLYGYEVVSHCGPTHFLKYIYFI